MSKSLSPNAVPSIRGAAINVIRAELARILANAPARQLPAEIAALLAVPVPQASWQPLTRWQPLIRELTSRLRKDSSGEAIRDCGLRIADSLFPGRYTFEEVRTTKWPAPVETLMVELARAVFNFGRWEFERVRSAVEGVLHAYDAEPLSEDGRLIIESVVAALAARALGAEVRTVSARQETGHVTFRIRRRGNSMPPGADPTTALPQVSSNDRPAGE